MSLLERTLSEIAKPKWEGAPRFHETWDAAFRGAQRLDWPRAAREWHCAALRRLAEARVLAVDPDQLNALPEAVRSEDTGKLEEWAKRLQDALRLTTLPFDSAFIDCGRARAARGPLADGLVEWGILGTLVTDEYVTPFIEFGHEPGVLSIGDLARTAEEPNINFPTEDVPGFDPTVFAVLMAFAVERTVAILQWLESVNVEIVEQPVSRQVRRNAERKGAEIAKIVRVKLPKSWRNGAPPSRPSSIDFSHRFEVRGHYKFFPEGTRLAQADPEKLSWVPEREGYFRRVWCPPFVKGPADKPLVPKTRQLLSA